MAAASPAAASPVVATVSMAAQLPVVRATLLFARRTALHTLRALAALGRLAHGPRLLLPLLLSPSGLAIDALLALGVHVCFRMVGRAEKRSAAAS
eukprot:1034114-Prymnesium_polylepis.1